MPRVQSGRGRAARAEEEAELVQQSGERGKRNRNWNMGTEWKTKTQSAEEKEPPQQ